MSEEDERLIDQDVVLERLVFLHDQGSGFWHLVIDLDLREQILGRAKQKAFLARYARIPWHAWEGRTVAELRSAMKAVSNIIDQESSETEGLENR